MKNKLKKQPDGGSSAGKRRKNKIPFKAKKFKAFMSMLNVLLSVLKVVLKVSEFFKK